MPARPVARLAHQLEAIAGPAAHDADLLARFVANRDDGAFAELVRRHGPAVLAVCRRITRHREDAEDAFQAVFLALARKAAHVRPGAAVGGWLFGAAVRASRKVLTRSSRRRHWESTASIPEAAGRASSLHDPEVVQSVLEEVARLSTVYRAAVVLCELEGRPRSAVARELGIPEGTLSSRLAAARRVLARRLRDRGLAPAVLAAVAGAASCPVLAADAARLAGGSPSPRVVHLSEDVMRTALWSKWWAVPAAALVAVVALAAGRDDPQPPAAKPLRAEVPAAGGRLLLMRDDSLTVLSPDGKEILVGNVGPKDADPGWAWLSPDGRRMAYLLSIGESERQPRVMIRDLDGGKFATSIDVPAMYLLWMPDGRSLVATSYLEEPWSPLRTEHVRIDLVARTVTKLEWPDTIVPVGWSPDDKSVAVIREGPERPTGHLQLMSADGKQVIDLTTLHLGSRGWWRGNGHNFSPDGKRLLFSDILPQAAGPNHFPAVRLFTLDLTSKKRTEVAGVPMNADVCWSCWSPDGKKIAYTWRQRHEELARELEKKEVIEPADVAIETEMFLVVADADGSNAKTIATAKSGNALEMPLRAIDWR
jgi:RNA polymerase sigma factor (sigma-70 family)